MAATKKQLRALSTFATEVAGSTVIFHAGEMVAGTHPVAKARPELFEVVAPSAVRPAAATKT